MQKFKKIPIVIEAEQWFEVKDFVPGVKRIVNYYNILGERYCNHCNLSMYDHGWINTLEGGHIICPSDWIIKGIKGEYYPCKPDIFEKTYEPVNDLLE